MAMSREHLSGSTDGAGIQVVATASLGTTIHQAGATQPDQIYCWASNNDSVDRDLTIEFGAAGAANEIVQTLRAGETVLVVPGLRLSGSLIVRAYAAAANVVAIGGFVMRAA